MLKDKKLSYALRMTLIIFSCLLASTLFFILTTTVIRTFGIKIFSINSTIYLVISLCISFVIAYIIAIVVSKKTGKDYEALKTALNEVANGNFDVVIPEIKSRRYLSPVIRDFNATVKQLKSLEIMRSEFITNFSHELKTPITSINGFAELLLTDDLTIDERKEYAQIIYNESNRLLKLAKNTLLLSKLEGQTLVSEKNIFSFDEMVTNAILIIENELTTKDLELEINLDKVNYYWDSSLLSQVVINLLSNAVKYSKKGGVIKVELHENDGYVFFSVKDNGIGMDEKTKAKIFDRYYQGDSSHKTDGNGLGLAIVQKIVDLCGGKIDVGSEVDKGSFFLVTLPERKPN